MPKRVRKPGRRWTQCRRRRCPEWEVRVPVPRTTLPILQERKTRSTASTNRAHVVDRCGDYHWVCGSAPVCRSYWGPPQKRGAASKCVAVWTRVDWRHAAGCAKALATSVCAVASTPTMCQCHVGCRSSTRTGVTVVGHRAPREARSGVVLFTLTLSTEKRQNNLHRFCKFAV